MRNLLFSCCLNPQISGCFLHIDLIACITKCTIYDCKLGGQYLKLIAFSFLLLEILSYILSLSTCFSISIYFFCTFNYITLSTHIYIRKHISLYMYNHIWHYMLQCIIRHNIWSVYIIASSLYIYILNTNVFRDTVCSTFYNNIMLKSFLFANDSPVKIVKCYKAYVCVN